MLIRLVYASTAQSGVDLNEFKRILLQAQANNHRRDLTGMLAFNSKIFLQALEGSRDQINDLYARLMRDPRHKTVTLLGYKEIEERHWANWSMGFAAPNTDNRALFLKYSQQSVFNPYTMKADAVEKMLMEIASTDIALTAPAAAAEAPAEDRPSQSAPLTAVSPLPRAPSFVPSVAPAAAVAAPALASAAAPVSAAAPATPIWRSASEAKADRPVVARPEEAPAGSGLFARFLNK